MSSLSVSLTIHARTLKVSLVIPMRNEEQSIGRLLNSIKGQILQPDEVILVDGGSTDRTVELAHMFIADDPRYQVIEAGPATPGRGRNVGCKAARFDWFAFTDAGIELEPNWLYELVKAAVSDPQAEVVYGNLEPMQDTFFTRCAAMTYVSARTPMNGKLIRGIFIASSLFHRSILEKAGWFPDMRAGEDHILFNAVRDGKFKVIRAPQAEAWWSLQPDTRSTFARFRNYSYHNVMAGRLREWHMGVARNYFIIAVILVAAYVWNAQLAWLALLLQAARAAKYIYQRRRGLPFFDVVNPAQFLMVFWIATVIDIATFVGWVQAWAKLPIRKSVT